MDEETAVATPAGLAQVFDLYALKALAPDKRVRKMLFKTDQLWSEIACYEPGQSTVMHSHPREEEAIFVRNLAPGRCVIMFVKVNPRVLKGTTDG